MLEILGTIFTSVLGGGATGLLGSIIQRYFDAKKAKNDLEVVKVQLAAAQETRRMELEQQERMAAKAADVQALQAQLEAAARQAEAEERSYQASLGSDKATYSTPEAQSQSRLVRWIMGVVDGVRGLMRPGITGYTLYMLSAVFWWVQTQYSRAGVAMTGAELHDLALQCVGTIFYLATTTVVWWFGVRPAQPPKAR